VTAKRPTALAELHGAERGRADANQRCGRAEQLATAEAEQPGPDSL